MSPVFSTRPWLALSSLGLWATTALAAPADLVLKLDTHWGRDNNPYRFPQDAPVPPVLGSPERGSGGAQQVLEAVAHVPLLSEQTRLVLSTKLANFQYSDRPELDHHEGEGDVRLQWRMGPLWQAELQHDRSRSPYPFQDGSYLRLDTVRVERSAATLVFEPSPQWAVPASVQRLSRRHEDLRVHGVLDRQEEAAQVALRYTSPTGSQALLGYKTTHTQFPSRTPEQLAVLDGRWQEQHLFADVEWYASLQTRLGARVGRLHRRYETLSDRDFSKFTTELRLTHFYSPKLRIDLDAWNLPKETNDIATLYSQSRGLRGSFGWQVDDKFRVSMKFIDETQHYIGARGSPIESNASLSTRSLGGRIQYSITRELKTYVDVFRERQVRSNLASDITQTIVRVGLSYTFENIEGAQKRTGFILRQP